MINNQIKCKRSTNSDCMQSSFDQNQLWAGERRCYKFETMQHISKIFILSYELYLRDNSTTPLKYEDT